MTRRISTTLQAARDLITDPAHWALNGPRDGRDRACGVWDRTARRFTGFDAIYRVLGHPPPEGDPALEPLAAHLNAVFAWVLPALADCDTHAMTLSYLDARIEAAQEREAQEAQEAQARPTSAPPPPPDPPGSQYTQEPLL